MQNKESSDVVPNTAHVLLHLATAAPNAQTSPIQSNQTNEANDPRPNDLGSICHSTLPWLISSSLGGLKWRHRQCCEPWHSTTGRHDGKHWFSRNDSHGGEPRRLYRSKGRARRLARNLRRIRRRGHPRPRIRRDLSQDDRLLRHGVANL